MEYVSNIPPLFLGLSYLTALSTIFQFYLKLCTLSLEIKESSQSDTRCCITTLWW